MKLRKLIYVILIGLLILGPSQIMASYSHNDVLKKRYVPRLKRSISFLGLGTVELGRNWGIDNNQHPEENEAKEILQHASQLGISVIDTASSYHLSEERIGRYLPKYSQPYLLITKPGESSLRANDPRCKKQSHNGIYCQVPGGVYDFTEAGIRRDIANSLSKLKIKQIDIALLHLQNETAVKVLEKGEALKTLALLRDEGKIKHIGVSVNGPGALYAVQHTAIDVIELEYNLLNQSNGEAIKIAGQRGIVVFVRGALGTGLLTKSVAKHINDPHLPFGKQVRALLALTNHDYDQLTALALYFLHQDPNISGVLMGTSKAAYLSKNIELLNRFNDSALLSRALKLMKNCEHPTQFTEMMGEYYL